MTVFPVLTPIIKGVAYPTTGEGVGGSIITSIFADGTGGFYFDFSKTDRLFQTARGAAATDDPGENIGLSLEGRAWGGKTLTDLVASQPELISNGDFSNGMAGWSGTWGVVNGEAVGPSGAAALTPSGASNIIASRMYRVSFRVISSPFLDVTIGGVSFGSSWAAGVQTRYALATSTAKLAFASGGGANSVIDDISVKKIPGNHGLQATTAAQPKWQTGGLARFDGSDDHLLTVMQATTAMSLVFKCKAGAVNGYLTGVCATGISDRLYLGFSASGELFGLIGAFDGAITRAGSLIDTVGVAALVVPGDGTAELFWNGVSAGTASGLLAVNLTQVFAIGAVVIGGTPQSFFTGDIYHALAIKKALTAAEIAAITNLWGTT